MTARMRTAFGCHLLVIGLATGFGLVYLIRSEFMPHHAEAVGRHWGGVEPPFQVLILALMRGAGGALLATALALGILLFVPFRQGLRWARWAIPAIGLVATLSSLHATLYVARHTQASPPYTAAAIAILLLLTGLVLSLEGGSGSTAQDPSGPGGA